MGSGQQVLATLHPGEIYRAFIGRSEPHPVIVVSREDLNRGDYFLAVPCTTSRLDVRRTLPNCVHFQKGSFGLWKECVAQAEALTLFRKLDLAAPREPVGKLSHGAMQALIAAIGSVINADCQPTRP